MREAEGPTKAEVLREKLGARGGHYTRQRAAVYDFLNRVDHHPTAEEVFLAVKKEMPRISLATVYKNLEALVSYEVASKLTYGDSAARYDIRTDHHYHSRCLKCGKTTDLEPEADEEFFKLIKPPQGFEVGSFRLEVIGYCQGCK